MAKYILKRILYILAVLLLLSFLVFAVYNMLPVDKAADMAMQEIAANKNLIYAERYLYWQRRLGLDGGLLTRYLRWLGFASYYDGSFNGLLQGNLGTSVAYGKPVAAVIKEPLFFFASTTTMISASPLIIRLRIGKCIGNALVPIGYSEIIPP